MWRDRIKIEERINDLLPSEKERSDFLSDKCRKTIEKLKYAERQGVNVTEFYFLLSIVYNETMHWENNVDQVTLIVSKLENLVVKNMIRELFKIAKI